jgi:MYXO-CTERM domain-containing protein
MKIPISRTQSLARVSTLAAVATATGAHAAIVTFNTTITSNNSTSGSTTWNIDGTGVAEAALNNRGSSSKDFSMAGGFRVITNGLRLNGLAANVPISALKPFANISGVFYMGVIQSAVNFVSGASTYIGFQFNPSGTVLYGWADVTLTNGGSYGTFTVNSWAYDTLGNSILTGQTVATPVPEPASYAVGLGALALGAAALRRRRQARAVAA